MDPEKAKEKILLAALPHVPFDGWSGRTLRLAAVEAGLEPGAALTAFPGGPRDLVRYFDAYFDRRMMERLERRDLSRLRIRDRIATAVRTRLELLAGHREAVRRALAFLALPQNGPLALACLYRTVDAMWYAAGDTATDFNFYTKRVLLAGVYGSTVLYWLNDKSDGHRDTWSFLDRRISDVMQIQKLRGRLSGALEGLPNPFRLFGSPGRGK